MQADADGLFELVQRCGGLHQVDPRLFLFPQRAFGFVVFVLDLADDGLDQVLDGHQPVDAAVFVDHQRHVDPFTLHLLQQHADRHRRRRVQHRAQQLLQREPAAGAEAVLQGKVLQKHRTLRMVERALVHWQARETVGAEDLDQFVLADVDGHRDDFHLGDGHVIDAQPAQVAKPVLGLGRGHCRHSGLFAFLRFSGRKGA